MSQENVALTHQVVDSLNRRDLRAYLALMHADVEAVPRLGAIEGDYHGHDGLRRWWEDFVEFVPDFLIEVIAVRDLGGMTVVQARMRGRGAGSATPLDEPLWTAIEWRDGKVL
jgi:SnoaL-like domain